MNRISVRSRVDADGVLRITVPVGAVDADREVQITIESTQQFGKERSDYIAWLDSISGQWQGEYEHSRQGVFESRESL